MDYRLEIQPAVKLSSVMGPSVCGGQIILGWSDGGGWQNFFKGQKRGAKFFSGVIEGPIFFATTPLPLKNDSSLRRSNRAPIKDLNTFSSLFLCDLAN